MPNPFPGPPSAPYPPWSVLLKVRDTACGAYAADVKAFGVNATDGGYDTPRRLSASDGSIIIEVGNMSDWHTMDDDLIHIELTKGYRAARVYEHISKATQPARYAAYPLQVALREENAERLGIVGSAVAGRCIITRSKQTE